jgi:predicted aldo/keto reductase-like oxidoreductase
MQGACDGGGGSRRHFLKTAAATGAVVAAADPILAAEEPRGLPKITLGKTGQVVSRLGMGTSWAVQPSFVQAALAAGVSYIDTAEGYEGGKAEAVVGQVLERTGKRKDVYLVSKNGKYHNLKGEALLENFRKNLEGSLTRLRTDYLDSYYIHGIKGDEIWMLNDPSVRALFESFKKAKKIRFCGLSCHDGRLVDVLNAVAEVGWLDQVMFQYNHRTMDADALRRAVDNLTRANMGIIAMKSQGGAEALPDAQAARVPKLKTWVEKGFKKEQAAIKAVFADERIQVVVSEMTNRDQLKDNMGATRSPLTAKEARLLEEHRKATAHLYCHGCGHLCETAARGVPVATVLRYLRYHSAYGKRQEARALYQALPPEARNLAEADLAAAERACPHALPVVQLVTLADKKLS